jgi:RHS repeat-associated protein
MLAPPPSVDQWEGEAMSRLARRSAGLAVVVAVLAAMTLNPMPPIAGLLQRLPALARQRPVPVAAVPVRRPALRPMPGWRPGAVTWPTGVADVTLPAKAVGLPVWLSPAAGAGPSLLAASPVRVEAHPQRLADQAGVNGPVLSLTTALTVPVHVGIDYTGFAAAYGGDYGDRLHLVELPACALTSPTDDACRVQTPLASRNNVATGRVEADVALPGQPVATDLAARPVAAVTRSVVLAAVPAPDGSGGAYSATSLTPAGSWTAGGSAGSFSYAYPVRVPPVPGGLVPSIDLAYDSQGVDGKTSNTNNQASWIGDGWDYSPGSVERTYASCSDNPAGSTRTGDSCWNSEDTVTLSLGGHASTLVHDAATGAWRPQTDDGERVQLLTGAGNGAHNGEYWVVTTADGTRYYFGLNQLPGFTSGSQQTNSAWTVPVFATSSGQPCYSATFASSWCDQAWRWNLDYAVDTHGDAISYFYQAEQNAYSRDLGTKANTTYVRGGYLQKIQYGQRAGAVYSSTPAAQVTFSVAGRCTNATCPVSSLSKTTASAWPDVPFDQSCTVGAACTNTSPTFWSEYRLSGIATQGGASLSPVDSWALTQTFPATGDASRPSLWLSSITHTGQAGGAGIALPPTTFTGQALANRVILTNGYEPITRYRMSTIVTDTGGVIQTAYSGPACGSSTPSALDANTALCYPAYWTPPGQTAPILDWFNKFTVARIAQQDPAGGGVDVPITFAYSGAAWHHDDTPITKAKYRTWSQWRGFSSVREQLGQAPDVIAQTSSTYFQGMDGNLLASGARATATTTDSLGEPMADSEVLDGTAREEVVTAGSGGATVSDTIVTPWLSPATATQHRSGVPDLVAHLTGTQDERVITPLAGGGTRTHQSTDTYDALGRVVATTDVPDTADPAQTTCTTTSFADSTSAWILRLPWRTATSAGPCGATQGLLHDVVTFYDGATTPGAAPTAGEVTMVQAATSVSNGTPVYTTQSKQTYDQYGRPLTITDANQRATTLTYSPATGTEPTQSTATDAMGFTAAIALDPMRGLPLQTVTASGYTASQSYDALGRLTAEWRPGQSKAANAAPNITYSYQVSNSGPSAVTTRELNDDGSTYRTSLELYDSLDRPRETQTQTPDGGRLISDTVYDSHGWVVKESDHYYTTGLPAASLVQAPDSQVPSQTGYVYDGAGRLTAEIALSFANETSRTTTVHGGSFTTVIPPAGGTAETVIFDGSDRPQSRLQYHAGVTPDPAGPASGYDRTTYSYTRTGELAGVTDPAGGTWSFTYDMLGRQIQSTDPDTGVTTSTYDTVGQLTSETDARGRQMSYTYDAGGRPTAAYDTSGGAGMTAANQVAAWTYDTLKKGLPTSHTSFSGGSAYTTAILGYNAQGLPTATKVSIPAAEGPLAGDYITQNTYSATGRLTSYTDSAGGGLPQETVSIGYNADGSPTSVRGIADYVDSVAYDPFGDPQRIAFGPSSSSVWRSFTYDQQTRRVKDVLTTGSKLTAPIDDTSYTYDQNGQVTSVAHAQQGQLADQQCFQYDYLQRLTEAWAQGTAGCAAAPSASAMGGAAPYWQSYRYDVTGNRTSATSHSASGQDTTTANGFGGSGGAQPHTLQSQAVSSPSGTTKTSDTYDAAGNLTAVSGPGGSQALAWDARGKLASVTTSAGTTSYVYDAGGSLLVQRDPGQVTLFLPDAEVVLNKSTSQVTGTRFYSLGGDVVAARASSGSVTYLLADQQGTSELAVDGQTQAAGVRWFDPFGAARGPAPVPWLGGSRGFVGGTADPVTGYTNLGAREYDPANGRFLSRDPVLNPDDPQSLNGYSYASNDPVSLSDPSGLWSFGGFFHRITHWVSHVVHVVHHWVSHVYHAAVHGIAHAARAVRHFVSHVYHAAQRGVSHVFHAAVHGIAHAARAVARSVSHFVTSRGVTHFFHAAWAVTVHVSHYVARHAVNFIAKAAPILSIVAIVFPNPITIGLALGANVVSAMVATHQSATAFASGDWIHGLLHGAEAALSLVDASAIAKAAETAATVGRAALAVARARAKVERASYQASQVTRRASYQQRAIRDMYGAKTTLKQAQAVLVHAHRDLAAAEHAHVVVSQGALVFANVQLGIEHFTGGGG